MASVPDVIVLGPGGPVSAWLRESGHRVHRFDGLIDRGDLAATGARFLVAAGYQRLIQSVVLELFVGGAAVNIHPSLLPAHRGVDAVEWALVEGSPLGVTIHHIDAGLDTGDIIAQSHVALGPRHVDVASARNEVELAAIRLFKATWPSIVTGSAPRRHQPKSDVAPHRRADRQQLRALLPNGVDSTLPTLGARCPGPHAGGVDAWRS